MILFRGTFSGVIQQELKYMRQHVYMKILFISKWRLTVWRQVICNLIINCQRLLGAATTEFIWTKIRRLIVINPGTCVSVCDARQTWEESDKKKVQSNLIPELSAVLAVHGFIRTWRHVYRTIWVLARYLAAGARKSDNREEEECFLLSTTDGF